MNFCIKFAVCLFKENEKISPTYECDRLSCTHTDCLTRQTYRCLAFIFDFNSKLINKKLKTQTAIKKNWNN